MGNWLTPFFFVLCTPRPEMALPNDEKLALIKKHEKVRNKALSRQRDSDEQQEHEDGYNNNKFNQFISDRLPLDRRAWDTRPLECLKQAYTPVEEMPTVSVMIIFYNEARSTLLRTAWSVLNRSPPGLIKEILLVDDGSPMEHLHEALDEEVAGIPKTRVVRLKERVGLIRAKVLGVREATGEVVAFMDSHCEVNDGWLEPLLDRLVRNPKAAVCPVIDAIDADTFQVKEAIVEMGAFTWGLNFYWLSPPHTKHDKEVKTVVPFKSPAMAGGIFAMRRDYFIEMGEYDDGMDTWGGENFEMSFRVWMCGGIIENIPCSHIAHVFRTESPYKFKNAIDPHKTIAYNLNRVAEVWMDDHADIFYNVRCWFSDGSLHSRMPLGPHACSLEANTCVTTGIPLGSSLSYRLEFALLPVGTVNSVTMLKVSGHSSKNYKTGLVDPVVTDAAIQGRVDLREKLKCKSFDWYMKEVATYMYVPLPENIHSFGRLRNIFKKECVYHEGNPDGDRILAVFRDCSGPLDRDAEGAESVSWYLTQGAGFEGQLRHEAEYGSRCLYAHSVKKNARLSLARCYDQEFDDERLRWEYDTTTLQIKIYNKQTGCLAASGAGNDQLIIAKCTDASKPDSKQQWTFMPMPEADEHDEL
jgi:glycosyltransferase involved in cell wall biosynthesis